MLPTRSDEAPKLNVTLLSGFAVMKASPIEVNESVSDAAANTCRSPDTASVLHAGALDTGSEPVGELPGGADADAVAATPLRLRAANAARIIFDRVIGGPLRAD